METTVTAPIGAWLAVAFIYAIGMPENMVWMFVGAALKPTSDFVQQAALVFWKWART